MIAEQRARAGVKPALLVALRTTAMHAFRRALIWLALASPVSRITLFCLNLAVRNWQQTAQRRI